MSSSTLDDLADAYSRVSAANSAMLDRFAGVAECFHREGIRFVVLKGADVLSRLYGMRGTRPLSDVDLLVEEGDLPVIDRILLAQGFRRQVDGNPSYASADGTLSLDLVTSLWYLDTPGLAELWSRTGTRPFLATTVRCLSPEDLLIHLTAYAVVHRGQLSPAFTEDLHLLIRKEAPDWSAVVSRARAAQLEAPILHGLRHVNLRRPAAAIPDHVFHDLAPRNRPQAMLAWVLHRLVTEQALPNLGHVLLFLTARSGARLCWLREKWCPSRQFLAYRYGERSVQTPCRTRLLRWSHLCGAGLGLIPAVVRRLAVCPAERPS
jgi:hypothetical protein